MSRFHAGAAAFAMTVVIASVFTWNLSSRVDQGRDMSGPGGVALDASSINSMDAATLLAMSDQDDFFGIPLSADNSCIVIDNRARLGTYTDKIARLAYAANQFAHARESELGVVEARVQPTGAMLSESDPFYALPVIRIQPLMEKYDGTDRSYLGDAVALAVRGAADQIFVVISKKLSFEEELRLGAAVREAGVPVNIVGLGDASRHSYAVISAIGGGRYIPVSDSELDQLIERCHVELPERVQ